MIYNPAASLLEIFPGIDIEKGNIPEGLKAFSLSQVDGSYKWKVPLKMGYTNPIRGLWGRSWANNVYDEKGPGSLGGCYTYQNYIDHYEMGLSWGPSNLVAEDHFRTKRVIDTCGWYPHLDSKIDPIFWYKNDPFADEAIFLECSDNYTPYPCDFIFSAWRRRLFPSFRYKMLGNGWSLMQGNTSYDFSMFFESEFKNMFYFGENILTSKYEARRHEEIGFRLYTSFLGDRWINKELFDIVFELSKTPLTIVLKNPIFDLPYSNLSLIDLLYLGNKNMVLPHSGIIDSRHYWSYINQISYSRCGFPITGGINDVPQALWESGPPTHPYKSDDKLLNMPNVMENMNSPVSFLYGGIHANDMNHQRMNRYLWTMPYAGTLSQFADWTKLFGRHGGFNYNPDPDIVSNAIRSALSMLAVNEIPPFVIPKEFGGGEKYLVIIPGGMPLKLSDKELENLFIVTVPNNILTQATYPSSNIADCTEIEWPEHSGIYIQRQALTATPNVYFANDMNYQGSTPRPVIYPVSLWGPVYVCGYPSIFRFINPSRESIGGSGLTVKVYPKKDRAVKDTKVLVGKDAWGWFRGVGYCNASSPRGSVFSHTKRDANDLNRSDLRASLSSRSICSTADIVKIVPWFIFDDTSYPSYPDQPRCNV